MKIPEDDLPQILFDAYNEWLTVKEIIPQVRLEDVVNFHMLMYVEKEIKVIKNALLGIRLSNKEIEDLLIEFNFDHPTVFRAIQDRWDTCLVP